MKLASWRTIAALVCFWLLVSTATAHPFHGSDGEMQYDAETQKLEIAIRIWSGDLERAIRVRLNKRIDLDDESVKGIASTNRMLAEYFRSSFVVQEPEQPPLVVNVIGHELEGAYLWAYLEVPVESSDALFKLQFTNRVCFEALHDQVNSLTLRQDGQTITIRCDLDQPTQALR